MYVAICLHWVGNSTNPRDEFIPSVCDLETYTLTTGTTGFVMISSKTIYTCQHEALCKDTGLENVSFVKTDKYFSLSNVNLLQKH